MKKLFGNCTSCQKPSVFELISVVNQIENRVLAKAQCLECKETVYISFQVSIREYKKIEAKGDAIEYGDSSPHETPPSIDF